MKLFVGDRNHGRHATDTLLRFAKASFLSEVVEARLVPSAAAQSTLEAGDDTRPFFAALPCMQGWLLAAVIKRVRKGIG